MSFLSGLTIVFIILVLAWMFIHRLWPELERALLKEIRFLQEKIETSPLTKGWEGYDVYGLSEGKLKKMQGDIKKMLESE